MKKIKLLFLCAINLCFIQIYAQVYNGNLVFSNQAEIDNFSNLPYTSVNGNLSIRDDLDGQHNITNLAGLAGITAVTGVVNIRFNNVLINTAYLNLLSIGVELAITSNPALTDINGMGALTQLPGQIRIENNASLTSVTAFSSLASVGILTIQQNSLLTNLNGFSNLTHIIASFKLSNNNSLANLNSFTRLISVGSQFTIADHPLLSSLNGLSGLRHVGFLYISNNSFLTDFNGLSNVEVISNGMFVLQNPLLQNINGFSNLDTLGGASLIQNNNVLAGISGFEKVIRMGILVIELNPSLITISGFSNLRFAGGLSVIRNLSLTNISGFPVLDSIQGDFILDNNHSLTTVNAFSNLVSISSQMAFTLNYALTSVNAMPQLDFVGRIEMVADTILPNLNFLSSVNKANSIRISACKRITDLNALSGITNSYIPGEIEIAGNTRLSSISELSFIDAIGQGLYIEGNPVLANLQGLHNIINVGWEVHIRSNTLLTNINELIRLDSVGRELVITFNPGLTNLDGLSNLRFVKGAIGIVNNPLLSSFCGLHKLYDGNGDGGSTLIDNNLVNPTPEQIISAGPCSGPLPVRLLFFNSQCQNNIVNLNWKTGSENNSSHFIVEKSADLISWTGIAAIPAAGNTSSTKDYFFADNAPSINGFYRLAQYDLDGRVYYSGVLRSSCTAKDLFSVLPNPVKEKLYISLSATHTSKATISFLDSKGAIVKKQETFIMQGTNQLPVEMVNLAPGVYYLNVEWDNGKMKKTISVLKD